LDENSAPAAGAEIRLLGDGRDAVLDTDERGRRRVVVERSRGAPSFHIRSPDGSVVRIVTVFFTAGREGAEKTVVLSPADERANTVSIAGRVLDDRGRPVAGARLWLYCNHATMGGPTFLSREIGVSGEDGEFSTTMLRLAVGNTGWGGSWMEPWNYRVIAHKPGYGFAWAQAHGDPEVDGIEVSLRRADSLQGTVRDADGELLANVRVGVERIEVAGASLAPEGLADAPAWMQTRTDEKGRFVLADLPTDATVELGVSTCGAGDSYRAGQAGPDLRGIKLAEQRGDLDIRLLQRPAISGVLLTPDGQPASGVKVQFEGKTKGDPYSTFMHSEVTDEQGRFEYRCSRARTWTLWVTDDRYSGTVAKDLQVDLGEAVTLPDTVLGANAVVEGRVLDAVSGGPVAGVPVHYHPSPVDAGRTEVMGSTGADGAFRIGVPPGKISVGYAGPPPGYTWNYQVSEEMIDGRPLVRVTADEDKPCRVPLEVKSGEVVAGVTLYVTPEATLEGIVLDPDGKPWRYGGFAHVDLDRELVESHSYPPSGGSVDTDGTFRSRYLYSGVPVVATLHDPERKLAGGARATPRVGEDTQTTIEMRPLAKVIGRVLMPDGSPADGVGVHPSGIVIGPNYPQVRTGANGRFSASAGIVGTACSVYVAVPSGRERWETGAELKFRGRSTSVPVTSPDDVIHVGDIVLEPYVRERPGPTASTSVTPPS
jgi:hypothetical protein